MKRVILTAAIISAVLFIGCDSKDSESGQSTEKELMLYCGAGIRPPADALVDAFFAEYGVKVVPDYAGSEVLLSKIKLAEAGQRIFKKFNYSTEPPE